MTTILKIKNGVIRLPKTFQKKWRGGEVFAHVSDDTVVLKRIQPTRFWDTWRQLKPLTRNITRKDIGQAIKWARQGLRR